TPTPPTSATCYCGQSARCRQTTATGDAGPNASTRRSPTNTRTSTRRTNTWLRLLEERHRDVSAVGDEDQSILDSTSADRRQEESEKCTGQVHVRQQADRRCVGWLCRRGDRFYLGGS